MSLDDLSALLLERIDAGLEERRRDGEALRLASRYAFHFVIFKHLSPISVKKECAFESIKSKE